MIGSMPPFKIPTIMTSDELVDLAFSRAGKVKKHFKVKSKLARDRATVIAKIQVINDVLSERLKRFNDSFPSINNLHPFYLHLTDILIGNDRLKKALGSLSWARRKISGVCANNLKRVKYAKNLDDLEKSRAAVYGRTASVLKQIDPELVLLNSARDILLKMPDIDPDLPTIVIAGSPNVGKSMLVRRLSSAKPEIASYPFTTKKIMVGHFTHNRVKHQVIDTPGLLDKDPSEKKVIERQAALALEHLADIILFVTDPSEYCGYVLDDQLDLINKLSEHFQNVPTIVVDNKSDLKQVESERFKISAKTGKGISKLKKRILALLDQDDENEQESD